MDKMGEVVSSQSKPWPLISCIAVAKTKKGTGHQLCCFVHQLACFDPTHRDAAALITDHRLMKLSYIYTGRGI